MIDLLVNLRRLDTMAIKLFLMTSAVSLFGSRTIVKIPVLSVLIIISVTPSL